MSSGRTQKTYNKGIESSKRNDHYLTYTFFDFPCCIVPIAASSKPTVLTNFKKSVVLSDATATKSPPLVCGSAK
ncbi:hypothetical protein OAC98_01645, partial [Cyclobacteriaceae bacterium]|nr:hypothetical protein [Cyclobacteriaceae bacterium]